MAGPLVLLDRPVTLEQEFSGMAIVRRVLQKWLEKKPSPLRLAIGDLRNKGSHAKSLQIFHLLPRMRGLKV